MTSRRFTVRCPHLDRSNTLHAAAALLLVLGNACGRDDPHARFAGGGDKQPATDPDRDAGRRCPPFDERYRKAYKSCEVDTNCEAVTVQVNCAVKVYGVASAEVDAFLECAPAFDGQQNCSRKAPRAEDGRVSADAETFVEVRARCVERSCEARVEARACGSNDKLCTAGELCVSMAGADGTLTFECVKNPCLGQPLDCECAEPVCQRWDQLRSCAIGLIEDSDVYCKNVLR